MSDRLNELLLAHLARGDLDPLRVVELLRQRGKQPLPPGGNLELLRLLADEPGSAAQSLLRRLQQLRVEQATRVHAARLGGSAPAAEDLADLADLPDLPQGWRSCRESATLLQRWLELRTDLAQATLEVEVVPGLAERLIADIAACERDLAGRPWPWSRSVSGVARLIDLARTAVPATTAVCARIDAWLASPSSGGDPVGDQTLADIRRRLCADPPDPEREALLAQALAWSDDRVRPLLTMLLDAPWAQDRVQLALTLRLGAKAKDQRGWRMLLDAPDAPVPFLAQRPVELLLLWCRLQPGMPVDIGDGLLPLAVPPPVTSDAVLERQQLAPRLPPPVPSPVVSAPFIVPPPPPPPPPPVPPAPRPPPLWWRHLSGMLGENWYLVAGILMMVVGLSLLAYYTWDKHWLLRYTIMPALLACFTAGLGGLGGWLERRDASLADTAAWLRGAALALFPANAMTVVVMSGDDLVGAKVPAVAAALAIYMGAGTWLARRWSAAVHPGLGRPLGYTVVLLSALVALVPVVRAWPEALWLLPSGFYVGFIVAATVALYLIQRVVTPELIARRCVPWFAGASLTVVGLEAVAWVHGSLHQLPTAWYYAPLVIAAGALVLGVERRLLAGVPGSRRPESFLGYALVLLGILAGCGEPGMRVASFALGGVVWLRQGCLERLHAWIGCTLLALAVASVALLPGVEHRWWPGLGVALVLVSLVAARRTPSLIAEVLGQLRGTLLVLTVIVAVLVQWHDRSEPLLTAVWLLACAVLNASSPGEAWRRAATTVAMLAAMLPYLGCADMVGCHLHGNRMVFGLGLLAAGWMAFCRLPLAGAGAAARSSVLWGLGSLGLAAMVLRVLVEGSTPGDSDMAQFAMDTAGPLILGTVLVATAWWSRSLLPVLVAVAMVVVLLPGLRTELEERLHLVWGSGLGSALSALVFAAGALWLRGWRCLRDPGPGDAIAPGHPFPLLRHDHTLFTWPLIGAAIWLAVQVDTVVLWRHLEHMGVGTLMALATSGAVWLLLAAWLRKPVLAWVAWGPLLLAAGWLYHDLVQPERGSDTYLALLAAMVPGVLLLDQLARRHPWQVEVLALPTRQVLALLTGVLAVDTISALIHGQVPWPITMALLVVTVWQALAMALSMPVRQLHGWFCWILMGNAWLAFLLPGSGPLLLRLQDQGLTVLLALGLCCQAVVLMGSLSPTCRIRLATLLDPPRLLGLLLALMPTAAVLKTAYDAVPGVGETAMAIALLLVTAWMHRSAAFVLITAVVVYAVVHSWSYDNVAARHEAWGAPWHLGTLALGLALLGTRRLRLRSSTCGFPWLAGGAGWLLWPACGMAGLATVGHLGHEAWRAIPDQLPTEWITALALALVARRWRSAILVWLAVLVATAGGVLGVHVLAGSWLDAHGIGLAHQWCFGLGLALGVLASTRLLHLSPRLRLGRYHYGLFLAWAILALLAVNWLVAHDLPAMAPGRFVASALLALAVSRWFLSAQRHVEARRPGWCAAGRIASAAVALWSAALLVPPLRDPAWTLAALALPAIWFHVRAELGGLQAPVWRIGAAAASALLLVCWLARPLFQLVVFPGLPCDTAPYHLNAFLALLAGLSLMRLHGLGGTRWLGYHGGLAVMVSSYFISSWPMPLSPFSAPVAAAWTALVLAQLWLLAATRHSMLGMLGQALTRTDAATWLALRRSWGLPLFAGAALAVAWAITRTGDGRDVAPLLVGLASLAAHFAVVRNNRLWWMVAGLLLFAALHAGAVVTSWLPLEWAVWVLLAGWGAWLLAGPWLDDRCSRNHRGLAGLGIGLLSLGHLLVHPPWSSGGLALVAVAGVCALLTPRLERHPAGVVSWLALMALLAMPPWLAWWAVNGQGLPDAHAVLALSLTVAVQGTLARLFAMHLGSAYRATPRPSPLLADQALEWLAADGSQLGLLASWLATPLGILAMAWHYETAWSAEALVAMLALWAILAWSWLGRALTSGGMLSSYAGQACVLLVVAAIRRQLMLCTSFWTPELDVWASLAASVAVVGLRHLAAAAGGSLRSSLGGTLLLLPVMALIWTLIHHLGSDVALVVLGVHSLLYAHLGRTDQAAPFRVLAVAGFTAFIILALTGPLGLDAAPAWVLPIGSAVLVLVQLHAASLSPVVRNAVRLPTLLAMVASAGWYALIDERHPLVFNLVVLGLALVVMVAGSLMRLRLFLVVGFSTLILDLLVVLVRLLLAADRSIQMSVVGALVLLAGAGLVGGAVYVQANRAAVATRWERLRGWWTGWE